MDERDGILDSCMEGRTLFTLVCQGGAMCEGRGIHRWLRTRGISDQSNVGVGMKGKVFQLLLFLLLASALATLPLLLQAVALQHLLLLEFGVIPLALDSTDCVGLSGLRSILHMALMLWLSMPNIVLTNLVVFLFFLILSDNLHDSYATFYAFFFISRMPHTLLIPFILVQCMAMPSLLLFHSATIMWLHHVFLSFHGYT